MALAGTFNLVKIRLTIVTITTADLVRSSNNNVLGRQETQNLLQNGKSYREKHFKNEGVLFGLFS